MCKWKTVGELCLVKAGQTIDGSTESVACVGLSKLLPIRSGPFQNLGAIFNSLYANSSKHSRLLEYVRLMADGHMRECATAFHTKHSGANPTQRKRNAVQVVAAVGCIEFTVSAFLFVA